MTDAKGDKDHRYVDAIDEIAAVLEGENDTLARMATIASMLTAAFPEFSWCGFYRVDPKNNRELVVGPYQGPLGCLRIAFGRGVCGAAAERRETLVVEDVDAFPDHIACDASARSEIVVPVIDGAGALIAVLDVDSRTPATFDHTDARRLEALIASAFGVSAA